MTGVDGRVDVGEVRPHTGVSMALAPTVSLSTARLFQVTGAVSSRRLASQLGTLGSPEEPPVACDIVHVADPTADAESFALATSPDGPRLRVRLYEVATDERLVLLAGHPAVTSHAVMAEWAMRLRAMLTGDPPVVPEPPKSGIGDLSGGDVEDDWSYWRAALAGEFAQLELGGRWGRVAGDGRPAHRRAYPIGAAAARQWRSLAARSGVGVEVLAITGVALLLRRYLGVSDLILSVPLAGPRGENVVPLRLVLADDADVRETVRHVADRLAQARGHLTLPADELVRRLNPPRVDGRNPLDQIQVVVDALVLPQGVGTFVASAALGETGPPESAGPVMLRPVALGAGHVAGELRIVILTAGAITLAIQHPTTLDRRLAEALPRDLATIIDDLVAGVAPRRVLARATAIATDWPEPARAHRHPAGFVPAAPGEPAVADRFRSVAAAHAARVAIIDTGLTWTYAQLAAAAGGYAAAFVTAGLGPGDRVGIYLDQGAHAVAAMLGALAVGAAYVPLDPTYPDARIEQILTSADLRAVVTSRRLPRPVAMDRAPAELALIHLEEVVPAPYPAASAGTLDDIAYVLFTSGSTGRPKGVAQTQRALLAAVANHVNNLRITPSDRLSVLASFSHDMSLPDIFGALLAGAVLVPIDVRRHGLSDLAGRLAAARVTVYHSTPTLYRYLVNTLNADGRLTDVRVVLLGGEEALVSDVELARRHFAIDCVFVNGYGATEATFVAQHHLGQSDPLDRATVPIGFPLSGYEIELRDARGNPTVLTGELVIRSRYVAPGYWRDPERTAERFGIDPDGVAWYRTGDLARRLPDGRLVCLGRLDRQVKIHGYRVELGEVEAHLADQPGVVRAVAFARPGTTGEPVLYAYAQAAAGHALDGGELRAALAQRVPHFALPRIIAVRTELPLTPTGKVDVAALPTPTPSADAPGAAPRTQMERLVAAIWRDTLDVAEVNVGDNFFEAGGHSLLMAVVQRELARVLGRTVPLVTLFAHPTVGTLAAAIEREDGAHPVRPEAGNGRVRIEDRMARRRAARTRGVPPDHSGQVEPA